MMSKEQQERFIEKHLRNALMEFINAVNTGDRGEIDRLEKILFEILEIIKGKVELSEKQTIKILSLKAGVKEKAEDLEKRYKEFVASLQS